jgi:HEPN domain-containing protein
MRGEISQSFFDRPPDRFERTHILSDLLSLYLTVDKDSKKIANNLSSLEGYAVAIRYPGAIVSVELAEEPFKTASHIRKFVRNKLGIK